VIVAVALNIRKNILFTPAERKAMLRKLTRQWGNVEVTEFRGLLVDFARDQGAHILVRGLRAISDFEYEYQMAHMNRKLAADIDTVIMMTGERHPPSVRTSSRRSRCSVVRSTTSCRRWCGTSCSRR